MDDRDALVASLREFFADRSDRIVAAYLFGSRAAGGGHAESDVDVAVLVDRAVHPDSAARSELRVGLIGELMSRLATDEVDVVILNDVSPELGRKVAREGVRLFAPDPEAARVWERDVQLRAADLDPFLRMFRERLIRHYVLE